MLSEFPSGAEPDNYQRPGAAKNPNSSEDVNFPAFTKLRICYISNPNIIHTRRWVSWFANRGHTVCLLADVPIKEPWPEITVIDLSKLFRAPIVHFPVWALWLRRFIRQWHPDVLHAHRVNSAGWLAAASGFHPYVVTPWGSDVFIGPQRSWMARFLASYTLRHADRVTAISQAMRERVVRLGARRECVSNIHHGVNLDIFYPGANSDTVAFDLRQRLSLPDKAPLVFSPRAVHPIYNLDIILQAIPIIHDRFPEARYIFSLYNPDMNYKNELDGLIASMGLGELIRWLPPTSNPAEMADRYRLSDVVVSVPSSDGGTPLTVMEAMACGKPVVCSDLPVLREFISNGQTGWLVPVRQAAPLAEKITQLIERPEQAVEIGRRARQVVADKANQAVEMQHMEEIYQQLAQAREG